MFSYFNSDSKYKKYKNIFLKIFGILKITLVSGEGQKISMALHN
jgi:hypothetical protein